MYVYTHVWMSFVLGYIYLYATNIGAWLLGLAPFTYVHICHYVCLSQCRSVCHNTLPLPAEIFVLICIYLLFVVIFSSMVFVKILFLDREL